MRLRPARLPIAFVAFAALVLGGCNAFSGLDEQANAPAELFSEAKIALQQGDPEEAERQLRAVLEQAPDHEPARVKLTTTLLRKQDVDVMDFVRIARTINDELEGGGRTGATQTPAGSPDTRDRHGTCSFPESHTQKVFEPTSLVSFEVLAESQDVFDEVQELARTVMDGADPEAFAAADPDLSDELVAEVLLNAALAHAADAYVKIAQSGGDELTFYYVTPPGGETYMGYCAPDPATLDTVLSSIACLLDDLDYGRQIIRARAELLDSERARTLADDADEAYDVLVRELGATCSPSSSSSLAIATGATGQARASTH